MISKPTLIGVTAYIKPRQISVIDLWDTARSGLSIKQTENLKNLKDNKHNGDLSAKSKRKLNTLIDWLVTSAKEKPIFDKKSGKTFKFKINFVTLTIPISSKQLSESEVKKQLLNPWLVYARKYFGLSNYVWKMEFTKKGTIHFHLTTDTFIHYNDLKRSWNFRLRASGLLDDYFSEHGHYDANSTDVHSVKNIKNVGAYIAKYMIKSAGEFKKACSRIWGCNYELSRALKCSIEIMNDEVSSEIRELMKKDVKYKLLERVSGTFNTVVNYGCIYFPTRAVWQRLKHTKIYERLVNEVDRIRLNFKEMPESYYLI